MVRDALFGARRYEQFREIGMADDVLTARLKRLVDEGVLTRHRYRRRPDRYEYLLTEKGGSLAPVIGAMRDRGRRWTVGEDLSPRVVHAECGHEIGVEPRCPHCDRAVAVSELRPVPAGG